MYLHTAWDNVRGESSTVDVGVGDRLQVTGDMYHRRDIFSTIFISMHYTGQTIYILGGVELG